MTTSQEECKGCTEEDRVPEPKGSHARIMPDSRLARPARARSVVSPSELRRYWISERAFDSLDTDFARPTWLAAVYGATSPASA